MRASRVPRELQCQILSFMLHDPASRKQNGSVSWAACKRKFPHHCPRTFARLHTRYLIKSKIDKFPACIPRVLAAATSFALEDPIAEASALEVNGKANVADHLPSEVCIESLPQSDASQDELGASVEFLPEDDDVQDVPPPTTPTIPPSTPTTDSTPSTQREAHRSADLDTRANEATAREDPGTDLEEPLTYTRPYLPVCSILDDVDDSVEPAESVLHFVDEVVDLAKRMTAAAICDNPTNELVKFAKEVHQLAKSTLALNLIGLKEIILPHELSQDAVEKKIGAYIDEVGSGKRLWAMYFEMTNMTLASKLIDAKKEALMSGSSSASLG